MSEELQEAINHPLWIFHKRNISKYTMDGKPTLWSIVYYPIFEDGKTGEVYPEPRALVEDQNKKGFWSKEVPLRYLTKSE